MCLQLIIETHIEKDKIVIRSRIHCFFFIVLIIDNNYALMRNKCINNWSDNCSCIEYCAYDMCGSHMFRYPRNFNMFA